MKTTTTWRKTGEWILTFIGPKTKGGGGQVPATKTPPCKGEGEKNREAVPCDFQEGRIAYLCHVYGKRRVEKKGTESIESPYRTHPI